jgi:hypothetical protein
MNTGLACPTCPDGITHEKNTPCKDCQIEAMPDGLQKAIMQAIHGKREPEVDDPEIGA